MIYSDDELRRWWFSLPHCDREALLEKMVEVTGTGFARDMLTQYRADRVPFTPKQLGAFRRWAP